MYAIIKTGGKQYRVKAGDHVRVEKIDKELGSELDIDVLMIGGEKTFVTADELKNSKVTCVVNYQARSPKILVFKKKRRQGYRKMQGHRQSYTELFVKEITSPDGESSKAEVKAKKTAETKEAKPAKKTVAKKATAKKATKKKTTKKAAKKTTTKKKVSKAKS